MKNGLLCMYMNMYIHCDNDDAHDASDDELEYVINENEDT